MWLTGIDGSRVFITNPNQIRQHWFSEECVCDNFPRPKLPYKIVARTDLAVVKAGDMNSVDVVLSEWDDSEDMQREFAKNCKDINEAFYQPVNPTIKQIAKA